VSAQYAATTTNGGFCPLCRGPARIAFRTTDRNRGIGEKSFRYAACARCRSIFLVDVPHDLGAYYPDEYYQLPSREALRREAAAESYRMSIVRRFATGGRLVEIGPGNGIFAIQAIEHFDTTVIEMDPRASAYLREVVGVKVVESAVPEDVLAGLAPSDAIVAWHVFEHLRRPWEVLEAAAANLRPGGILVLAMPNPNAFGFRVLQGRWPHVDAPRHLYLLPPEELARRGSEAGLDVVMMTANDPGSRHWTAFAWQYVLRRPGASYLRERLAQAAGRAIALLLAPIERRDFRGAAYTMVLQKRDADMSARRNRSDG
jgi:SAM-dependent methyltransferase